MMLGTLPHPNLPSNKVMVATVPLMEAVVAVVITIAAVTMAAEVVVEGLEDITVAEGLLNLPLITAITLNHHLVDPKTVSIVYSTVYRLCGCLAGGYIPPEEWVKPQPRNERVER